ncbi:hypothetical protein M0R45_004259 [Rubus argutus]|uniref:Uncharacterized protein n=1 Tax=Rubus argutus TaxID=59490 RepID=A0AAW1YJ73_RUBAR
MRKTERNHARIGSNVDIFGNPKLFGNGQRFCAKEVHDEHVVVQSFMSCRADRNAGRTSPHEYNDFEDGVCLEEFSFDLGSVERDDEELKIVMAGEVLGGVRTSFFPSSGKGMRWPIPGLQRSAAC